jgi:hypothetical protein
VCKLAAPLAVSFVAAYITVPITMLAVAGWCLLAFPVELALIQQVYNSHPTLALPKHHNRHSQPEANLTSSTESVAQLANESSSLNQTGATTRTETANTSKNQQKSMLRQYWESWGIYASQPVVLPALALSFLVGDSI